MSPKTRHAYLESAVAEDQLLLHRVRGEEELGRPFDFKLEMLSPDPALALENVLGSSMTIVMALEDGERYFNGVVARIGQGGTAGRFTRYHCTLRPWLWLLTRASDSRIYRQITVPDLVKKVVQQFGLGQLETKLQQQYLPREYLVQYRETYFDFVSRLLEEEGIYYYFRHEEKRHVMVLCDDRVSHSKVSGYEKIVYRPPAPANPDRFDYFSDWTLEREVESGGYGVNDFDFEAPRADLLARQTNALKHKHANLEQYDPLAGFVDAVDAGGDGDSHRGDRGTHYARVRLEELQAAHDRTWAAGTVRGPHAGALFELTDHPRGDQNREMLVIRGEYQMFEPGYDAASAAGQRLPEGAANEQEPSFAARFLVQPSDLPFRPRRLTPRPQIPGPHTAIVVGQGEIWTDKYGRVKVHFPWDREDTEGCWVRVSQAWAGAGWGGMHVPRVGQEVLVEFIEGDPDRPIITGRVYNASNPPPFGLPDGATQSGMLSRSSKGGTKENANEIRFEDKKDAEMLYFHAERDQTSEVEHDESHSVGNDRTKTIGNDEAVEVKRNRNEKVGGDETIAIAGSRAESVSKDETVSVTGQRAVTITKDDSLTVNASRTKSIAKDEEVSVGGTRSGTVGKNESIQIGGKREESVGKSENLSVGESRAHSVGKDDSLDVGRKLHISAGDEVTIQVGAAKLVLKSDGTVQIQGANITIKGSGTVALKGSSVVQN